MTERRSRFASTLRVAACALAAVLACGLAGVAAAAPAYTPPGTGGTPPLLPAKPPPVIARVIAMSIHGDELIITIGAGANSGVGPDWKAQLLRGESEDLLAGVEIAIVRVDKALTVGRIKASSKQLRWHSRVKLSPP